MVIDLYCSQDLSPLSIESTLIYKIHLKVEAVVEKIENDLDFINFESDSFKRIIDKELAMHLSSSNSPSPSPRSDNVFNDLMKKYTKLCNWLWS